MVNDKPSGSRKRLPLHADPAPQRPAHVPAPTPRDRVRRYGVRGGQSGRLLRIEGEVGIVRWKDRSESRVPLSCLIRV